MGDGKAVTTSETPLLVRIVTEKEEKDNEDCKNSTEDSKVIIVTNKEYWKWVYDEAV